MEGKFLVRHCDGRYLAAVNLGCRPPLHPVMFVHYPSRALAFENQEIAEAVIRFVADVLDFELAEELEVVHDLS